MSDIAEQGDTTLGRRAARGAIITVAAQITRIAIQSIGVVVMARILVPADFGLFAMVTAIVGVAELLRDFGLAHAAVQAPELSKAQRSNLFWLNTALGIVTGAVVFGLAWPIAALYGDSRLIAITQLLTITFIFNGIASQYRAHLQRSLSFVSLVVAELAGLSVGVAVGIYCGIYGWGYWALVCQFIANSAVVMVVLIIASGWLPRGFYRNQNMRQFVRFGIQLLAYQLLNYASKNVDTVIIGQRFGPTSLGYYNRAFQLLTLPLSQIATPLLRVALPVLSRVQFDIYRFNSYLQKGQSALLAVMLFLLFSLGALSEPTVAIVLGADWAPSADLFRILAIAGVFQMLSYPSYWAYLALGLTGVNLRQALIARPLAIVFVLIGALFSVEGVAWGYAIGAFAAWPISLVFLSRASEVNVSDLARNSLRLLAVNLVGGLCVFLASKAAPGHDPWLMVLIGVITMIGVIGVCSLIFKSVRADYATAIRAGRQAVRRRVS